MTSHKALLEFQPNALLILVPRHPERFDEVYQLCQKLQMKTARRSGGQPIANDIQVYLADTMGELLSWYQGASVAFVGGSLIDGIGGHNPIEPASTATAIVVGKFTKSCDELVADLASVGACKVIDEHTLATTLIELFNNPSQAEQMGQAGYRLFTNNQTAYLEQKAYLLPYLQ